MVFYKKNIYTSTLIKLTIFFYLFLIFLSSLLPSGYFGQFNVKIFTFIITTLFFIILSFTNSYFSISFEIFIILFVFVIFLLISLGISLTYQETELKYSLDSMKNFISTLCIVFFSYFFYKKKMLSFNTFFKTLLVSNFLFAFIKITLITLLGLNFININDFLSFFLNKFNYNVISMEIESGIMRLQFINDILTPYIFFYLLLSDFFNLKIKESMKNICYLVFIISIILSFSRYIWLITLIGFLLSFIIRKRVKLLASIFGCIFIIIIFTPVSFFSLIEKRFSADINSFSDSIREEQKVVLLDEISKNPIFGKGVGGYSKILIRDDENLYSYELQWLAFFMQFGIFGLLVLVSYMSLIGYCILPLKLTTINLSIFIMYILWLLSGFTNPYLVSSTSATIFSLFLLSGLFLNKKTKIVVFDKKTILS